MSTTPRTETPALIMAMEHWAKTVAKNGGIAAVTIQEGADRLRELEVRAELAEASAKLWEADALRYANNTEFWKARAEKAEAELAIERARLDWLEQHRDVSQCYDKGDPEVGLSPRWELSRHIGKHGENLWDDVSYGETLRAAIDAAMKEASK